MEPYLYGSVNGDDAPEAMVVFPDGRAHPTGTSVGAYQEDFASLLYNPRFRALTVPANQIVGDLISGDVNSLFAEDTNYLKIASGEGSECGFVATTTACPTDFTSGKIRVKARSTLTGTRLKIDVYNFTYGHPDPWTQVYKGWVTNTSFNTILANLPSPLSDYIDDDGTMKVRVRNYISIGGESMTLEFQLWTDFTEWTLMP